MMDQVYLIHFQQFIHLLHPCQLFCLHHQLHPRLMVKDTLKFIGYQISNTSMIHVHRHQLCHQCHLLHLLYLKMNHQWFIILILHPLQLIHQVMQLSIRVKQFCRVHHLNYIKSQLFLSPDCIPSLENNQLTQQPHHMDVRDEFLNQFSS